MCDLNNDILIRTFWNAQPHCNARADVMYTLDVHLNRVINRQRVAMDILEFEFKHRRLQAVWSKPTVRTGLANSQL